jgi:hypothetical protein
MLKQEHEMSNVMQNFAMKNKHRNSVQPKMIIQCKYKKEKIWVKCQEDHTPSPYEIEEIF